MAFHQRGGRNANNSPGMNTRNAAQNQNFVRGGQLGPQQGQQKPQLKVEMQQMSPAPKPLMQQQIQPPAPVEMQPPQAPAPPETGNSNGQLKKEKPAFFLNKVSKKVKQRRRNDRLSRILQPKNAVMVLNEIRPVTYTMNENSMNGDYRFSCTINIEGENLFGQGRCIADAKNAAAENALKHLIRHRLHKPTTDAEGDEKMEASEPDPLPWQHIASFAMHKLVNQWGSEFIAILNENGTPAAPTDAKPVVTDTMEVGAPPQKAAKAMPPNAVSLNPVMLLNQMLPNAEFVDKGITGIPPNTIFNFEVTINDKTFSGSGPNKKAAKKQAAYGVCHGFLGVEYPKDVYTPTIL